MLKLLPAIVVAGTVFFTGCERELAQVPGPTDPDVIPVIVDLDLYNKTFALPQDTLAIDEAVLEEDVLKLTVSFGGGCTEHLFSLITSTFIVKTGPPKAFAILTHDANGETCLNNLREELKFDLTPLKNAFSSTMTETYFLVELAGTHNEPPFNRVKVFYKW